MNDIFLFSFFNCYLQIDALYRSLVLVLEDICVLVDDIVESNLEFRLDFAYTVDGAHY